MTAPLHYITPPLDNTEPELRQIRNDWLTDFIKRVGLPARVIGKEEIANYAASAMFLRREAALAERVGK